MDNGSFRKVLGALEDALAVIERAADGSFCLLDVNRAWESRFGRSPTGSLPQPLAQALPFALATQAAAACERCLAARAPLELQVRAILPDGPTIQSWRLSPISESEPKHERVTLLSRTLPSDAALTRSERQYWNILEQTSDLIGHFDSSGRILYFNAAAIRAFALDAAHVVGRRPTELWPDGSDALELERAVAQTVLTGAVQHLEHKIDLSGGGHAWYQMHLAPERDARAQVIAVIAVGRDISPLKNVLEKLRKSEQQFRTLAENSPDHILRYDRELRVVYVNPAVERYAGRSLEQIIGTRVGEHPETSKFRLSVGLPWLRDAFARALQEGRPLEFEAQEITPSLGKGSLCLSFLVVPERDSDRNITGLLAIGRDVTHLKAVEAELRLLNATLEQSIAARTGDLETANRELQSFAHTVSHDLRAPLRAIIGFATIVKEEEADNLSERGRVLLERVCAAGAKLNHLLNDILEYSHASQAALSRRPVALGQLAREVADELLVHYPRAKVQIDALPEVCGDPMMLRQVLQNLIGNALKFSARREHPQVAVSWSLHDDEIVFHVRDNGVGFDARYADHLGKLFQRLHSEREYPGSGVGLAIVQRLLERHGGRLWAQGGVDAGATFYFTIPTAAPEIQPAAAR